MRWLSRSWAAAQAVVTALFLAALGLGGLELLARAWPDDPPAPRATADAFQGQPDAEATLDEADFGDADLSHSQYPDATAMKTRFAGAKLDGAVMEGADLRGANLAGASIRHGLLAHAKLDAADLTRAILDGADLHRVEDHATIWTDASLGGVRRTNEKRAKAEDFVPKGS